MRDAADYERTGEVDWSNPRIKGRYKRTSPKKKSDRPWEYSTGRGYPSSDSEGEGFKDAHDKNTSEWPRFPRTEVGASSSGDPGNRIPDSSQRYPAEEPILDLDSDEEAVMHRLLEKERQQLEEHRGKMHAKLKQRKLENSTLDGAVMQTVRRVYFQHDITEDHRLPSEEHYGEGASGESDPELVAAHGDRDEHPKQKPCGNFR